MSQAPSMKVLGLYKSPNTLSPPDGALLQADNCVIRSQGIVEPRLGQELLADAGGYLGGTDYPNTLVSWNGLMYGHFGTNKLAYYSGGGWQNLGSTHNPPDSTLMRMKFQSALERLYFTTDAGIYRTTGAAAKLAAGNQPLIDWADSHAASDTNGFLTQGDCCAYRVTMRDLVGSRWVQGAPSGRAVVNNPAAVTIAIGGLVRTGGNTVTVTCTTNHRLKYGDVVTMTSAGEANFANGQKTITQILSNNVFVYSEAGTNAASTAQQTFALGGSGGLCKVSLRVLLPTNATVSTVVEVWRSVQVAIGDTPSDDVFQVFQGYPSAADVTAGYITVTDNTPEVLLGDPGYFTPAVEGILASNDAPPLAKDLCLFNDVMVLGNLTEKHTMEIRLLATGASGIQSGDVITFARGASSFGVTMAHNQTGGQAVVYDNGDIAEDIQQTAQSIVDAINSHASNSFLDAFYASGDQDAPGLIFLRARDFSATQFTASLSAHSTAFNPELSSTKTAARSTQVTMGNGVAWCKPSQADACPAINRQPVGDALEKVLRVVALRDRIIIVKERSAWMMTGSYNNWRFTLLDNTVHVVGADTVAVLNNQVHALTSQGVATITEIGVGLLSPPVFDDLATLMVNNLTNVKKVAWGAGYELEHQYLLGIPGSSKVLYVYVWNAMTHAWTRWTTARTCAAVDQTTELLWLGDSNNATARRERKTFGAADYKDEQIAVTKTGGSGTTVALSSNSSVSVGDYLEDSTNSSLKSRVTSVDTVGGHNVTVADTVAWASNNLYCDKSYACDVEWVPMHFGKPGTDKRLTQAHLHLRDAAFSTGALFFSSDKVTTEQQSGALAASNVTGPENVVAWPDKNTSYSSHFTLRFHLQEALAAWKLQGISPSFVTADSERTTR